MDIGLLIDGDEKAATGKASYERLDPFTGKLATRAAAEHRRRQRRSRCCGRCFRHVVENWPR